jgi:hypothetical protein
LLFSSFKKNFAAAFVQYVAQIVLGDYLILAEHFSLRQFAFVIHSLNHSLFVDIAG